MDGKQSLQNFHRINLILWAAIISFIVILSIVTLILDAADTIQPIEGAAQISQIIFFLAVALAFSILIFKRSLFMPAKILNKLGEIPDEEKKYICLNRLRVYYVIVWAMGEAICVLGFVNYILTVDSQNFLIFAVVSLYSVLINMPRLSLLEKCSSMNQINM